MSDLAFTYRDGIIDLDLGDGGRTIEDGLMSAVVISLFSDRRADSDDALPGGSDDRRGWWGDIYPAEDGDRIGSRLWLLSREKQTSDVMRRAETYAAEALQWMVDDGIAQRIEAVAENPAAGVLALQINIHRPSGEIAEYRFDNLWEALNAV